MPTFGVTSAGFVPKQVQDILSDIEADQRTLIAPDIDTDPDQPLGQLNGIYAGKAAEIWEALDTAFNGFNPDATEDYLLDALCALTGTKRLGPQFSTVPVTVNLDAGKTLPTSAVANVSGQPNNRWQAVQGVGLAPGIAAQNTGGSPANVSAVFQSQTTGPNVANATTLTVITTPVTGWNSITNATDANLGSNLETDTELRVKRQEELAAPGAGTVDAIRADLLRVLGVIDCFVFENVTDVVDANGQPPHCIHAVIDDGAGASAADADIAKVIWADKGGGIHAYGAHVVLTLDSQGKQQAIAFDRANRRDVYMSITVTQDGSNPNYVQNVKDAMAAYANGGTDGTGEPVTGVQGLGKPVIALGYKASAITVPGVTDAPTLALDFTASPVATANLTVGPFDRAIIDTSRILVNGL